MDLDLLRLPRRSLLAWTNTPTDDDEGAAGSCGICPVGEERCIDGDHDVRNEVLLLMLLLRGIAEGAPAVALLAFVATT